MKYCNCVKILAVYYYWNSYTIHTVTYGGKEKTETYRYSTIDRIQSTLKSATKLQRLYICRARTCIDNICIDAEQLKHLYDTLTVLQLENLTFTVSDPEYLRFHSLRRFVADRVSFDIKDDRYSNILQILKEMTPVLETLSIHNSIDCSSDSIDVLNWFNEPVISISNSKASSVTISRRSTNNTTEQCSDCKDESRDDIAEESRDDICKDESDSDICKDESDSDICKDESDSDVRKDESRGDVRRDDDCKEKA